MKDKIEKLLEQIKRDFPDGCDHECDGCVLDIVNIGTMEITLCDLLYNMHE